MLHEFIVANRDTIIERTRSRVRARAATKEHDAKLEHGIPLFLGQLVQALAPNAPLEGLHLVGARDEHRAITDSATLHGHELLRNGFSVAQVVHGYGDVCQVVTEMAGETSAAISAAEFQVFNRCLDDAIAGAVTAYGLQRERDLVYEGSERLGEFAHEVRNLLSIAILSFDIIKKGMVGLGGSTGAVHARSLSGLNALVERSFAEVRLATGLPSFERVFLCEFVAELEVSALMQAEGCGVQLSVGPVEGDVAIDADRQLLASAVTNLLQNAFKFTKPGGGVSLMVRATEGRVAIDVGDKCGGLPAGKADDLFRPFVRGSSEHSGLGLGLSIALSAVRAHSGELSVRDVPGVGCVFTIDLPRSPPPARALFQALPHGEHGAAREPGHEPAGAHSRDPTVRIA
jgi:signal transduction histidine kinase